MFCATKLKPIRLFTSLLSLHIIFSTLPYLTKHNGCPLLNLKSLSNTKCKLKKIGADKKFQIHSRIYKKI